MAKVLGQAGRYVSEEATSGFRRTLVVAICTISLLSLIGGLLIGFAIQGGKCSAWLNLATAFLLLFVLAFSRSSIRTLDALERERLNMRRGAKGETVVAITLQDLPESYQVINDITTRYGNLDHVVIGPTGVFVIDTKDWRGVVTADGRGELLLNGRATDKPSIKRFVARMMSVKEQVRDISSGIDPYFQPVFVFTSARVNANWGTTGTVHCIRDEQLYEYIVGKRRVLAAHETKQIAQALVSLAAKDAGFDSREVSTVPRSVVKPRQGAVSYQGAA